MNQKLLETLADIAYHAGYSGYYSGNSREDILVFIEWAKEFEMVHKHTDWNTIDYMLAVEAFSKDKISFPIP